jgi:hypothetical protein
MILSAVLKMICRRDAVINCGERSRLEAGRSHWRWRRESGNPGNVGEVFFEERLKLGFSPPK